MHIYFSKKLIHTHLDPDLVVTTLPPTALPLIGEVVIGSPFLKDPDPLMIPVMEPSLSCLHFEIVGTPPGAVDPVAELVESSLF